MKKSVIAVAVAGVTSITNLAYASTDENVGALEKRLQYLEQRVASQDQLILANDTSGSEAWLQKIEFGGLVEVEAQQVSPDGSPDESDIYVATAELGITAHVNDWTTAEMVFLYEDEGDHSGEIAVDSAVITIANPDASWYVTAGQYALPFGNFHTHLVSDPITLDAAETYDAAVEVGLEQGKFAGSVYVYSGDEESEVHNFGANLAFATETEGLAFNASLGWVNDLSQSDLVVDEPTAMTNKAAAWTAFAQVNVGLFSVVGEYVATTESLDAYSTTDKPSFFNIEAAIDFTTLGRPAIFAVGVQGSSEASAYAGVGGIDEDRILAALSMEITEGNSLSLEYAAAENYAGVDTDTITIQLAAEF